MSDTKGYANDDYVENDQPVYERKATKEEIDSIVDRLYSSGKQSSCKLIWNSAQQSPSNNKPANFTKTKGSIAGF